MSVFQNDHTLDKSDGADNTLNTPVDVVEDAKQTHPHHEKGISDYDDVVSDPDYTPFFDEFSEGVIKDHPETQGNQSQTQKYVVALCFLKTWKNDMNH